MDSILKHTHWTLPSNKIHNQIGIRHRLTATDIWMDSAGSLYDKELNQFIGKESDFSEWNPQLPNYTKTLLDNLMLLENIKIGRIDLIFSVFLIIFLETIHYIERKFSLSKILITKPIYVRWTIYCCLILAIIFFGVFENRQFIYFQF